VIAAARLAVTCTVAVVAAACATLAAAPTAAPPAIRVDSTWVERTLDALSLREQAAQMVWPSILGDYQALSDERWERTLQQVRDEKVGGYTISVGSPLDIAAKVDAMQQLATVPLLFAADFESGAGMRARGGVFLPNNIELGGATWTSPLMAIGAANDTALSYALGRLTAIGARARGFGLVRALTRS